MSKISIRLTADELNKFIGDDNELALEIKGSIVQQFAERHLKGVINNGIGAIEKQTSELIQREFEDRIVRLVKGVGWGTKDRYELKPEIKKDIQSKVSVAMSKTLSEVVDKAITETIDFKLKDIESKIVNMIVERYTRDKQSSIILAVEKALKYSDNA